MLRLRLLIYFLLRPWKLIRVFRFTKKTLLDYLASKIDL